MYALVVFLEDNEHYVCSTKNISGRFESNQVVPVKWLDNRCYPARVICTHESSAFLEKLDKSITEFVPRVVINSCDALLSTLPTSMNSSVTGNVDLVDGEVAEVDEIDRNPINKRSEKFTTDLFSYGEPSITGDICDNVTAVTVSSFDTADGDYGSDNSIQDPNYIPAEETNSSSSIVSEDHQQSVNHEEPEYENETEEANTRGFVDVSFTLLPQTERVLVYENLPTFEIPKATGRYTRRYFCIYCKKLFAKLPKHLEHCHANEVAVESFIKLPAGSKDRKVIIEKIRRQGDYEHNTYKEYNTGTLLVARRTKVENHQRNVKIVTCPECKGQFYNYCFYKHFKRCSKTNLKGDKGALLKAKSVYQYLHPKACYNLVHRVFPVLRECSVVTVMRYDELGICVMNDMCRIYTDPHFDDMIRAKIRLMGRLLLTAREFDSTISDLASLMDPSKFDLIVQVINNVAGLNPEGTHYRAPSVATSLSTLCKRAANIWKIECLKKKDEIKKKNAEDFLSLLTVCNTGALTRTAIENRVEHQRQKVIQLPDKTDISTLVAYVRNKRRKLYQELSNYIVGSKFPLQTWRLLSEFTLISLLVFNRRRPGELERIKLQDYASLQGIRNIESLTEEEKSAAETYKRFEIRGKLNRSVPVLVHWEIELCVNLIIQLRGSAGVVENNPYVFGISSNDSRHHYLRACGILRKISNQCGAKHPHLLRVTTLRKHIATECAILDLSDNVIKDVANFMGHAEKIHNDIYRLPIESRDIARMSNILELVQGNVVEDDESSDNSVDDINEECVPVASTSTSTVKMKSKRRHVSGHRRFCGSKKSWSIEECSEVKKLFSDCLKTDKLPSYEEIQTIKINNDVLQARSPQAIRMWIENQLLKKRKTSDQSSDRASVVKRIRWSDIEKKSLYEAFSVHIHGDTLPSQSEVLLGIEKFPELKSRSVKCIKTAVLNEKNRSKRGSCM